jgi:hypothetical protein
LCRIFFGHNGLFFDRLGDGFRDRFENDYGLRNWFRNWLGNYNRFWHRFRDDNRLRNWFRNWFGHYDGHLNWFRDDSGFGNGLGHRFWLDFRANSDVKWAAVDVELVDVNMQSIFSRCERSGVHNVGAVLLIFDVESSGI